MPASNPSYQLRILGQMHALKDPAGESYRWLPCMDAPYAWSEDAPIENRRNAAKICRAECPALRACGESLQMIGAAARGVWAGEVIKRRNDDDMDLMDNEPLREHSIAAVYPDTIHIV